MNRSTVLFPFIGIIIAFACQNRLTDKPKTDTKAAVLVTHKEAMDSLRADTSAPIKPLDYADLDSSTAVFFDKFSLANLILNKYSADNGFYGPDNYRIEMHIHEVQRDSVDKNKYYVKGKSKYKTNITPFEGQITLENIQKVKDPNLDTSHLETLDVEQLYAAEGRFSLAEDSTYKGSGIFTGKVVIDFSIHKKEKEESKEEQDVYYAEAWYYSHNSASRGGALYYEGTWKQYDTHKEKKVLWARDLFSFANDILKDFSYGEREIEINEKYRHLGWQDYWEHAEWWNDTIKTEL